MKTMQDRLMELYTSAQRRSVRIVRQSSSAASLLSKSANESTTGSVVSGKWASRVDSANGVELFGRKVFPAKEKHKLTLELTSALSEVAVASLEDGVSISLPVGENAIKESNTITETNGDGGGERDDGNDDEDSDDGSKLFQGIDSAESAEKDDTDEDERADGLDIAQVKLDLLEQSARSLETWLEDMVTTCNSFRIVWITVSISFSFFSVEKRVSVRYERSCSHSALWLHRG